MFRLAVKLFKAKHHVHSMLFGLGGTVNTLVIPLFGFFNK